MAVYKVLPEKNLRAEDIRDTLLANGADWSNSPVPNANYLPNYFRKESNINMWSRYKPINVVGFRLELSDGDFVFNKFGLSIIEGMGIKQVLDEIRKKGCAVSYNHGGDDDVLRLSDFRGYNTKARSPNQVKQVDIVKKGVALEGGRYETLFSTFVNDDSDIKNVELFGFTALELHSGVIIDFGGDNYFWGGVSFDWSFPILQTIKGVAKVTHILTSKPLKQNLPFPLDCHVFVAADVNNYYDCYVTNQYPDRYFKFSIKLSKVELVDHEVVWKLTVSAKGDAYRGGNVNGLYVVLKRKSNSSELDETVGTHQIKDFYCEDNESYIFSDGFMTIYEDNMYMEAWENGKKVDSHGVN